MRSEIAPIINHIKNHAHRYDFYQLLRLLEGQNIRLTASPSLCFPAADVHSFDGEKIELNFMGLYGVDSPLPQYFLYEASKQTESAETLRAFLDMFNQRLYQLSYQAWKKYQPAVESKFYLNYLMALSGKALTHDDAKAFSSAGLLGKRVRSASGLASLLRDYLGVPVSVKQFVPCWVKITASTILGVNAVIGERVLDLSRKILIEVGPLALQQMPHDLEKLIQRYIEPTVDFKIKMLIQLENNAPLTLGVSAIPLGWLSWLGKLAIDVIHVVVPQSTVPQTRLR